MLEEFSEISRENCGGYIETTIETRKVVVQEPKRENENGEKGEIDD